MRHRTTLCRCFFVKERPGTAEFSHKIACILPDLLQIHTKPYPGAARRLAEPLQGSEGTGVSITADLFVRSAQFVEKALFWVEM